MRGKKQTKIILATLPSDFDW